MVSVGENPPFPERRECRSSIEKNLMPEVLEGWVPQSMGGPWSTAVGVEADWGGHGGVSWPGKGAGSRIAHDRLLICCEGIKIHPDQ